MEKTNLDVHAHDGHDHEHEEHNHDHSHSGKFTTIMFFVGVAAFIAGFLLEGNNELYAAIAFLISVVTAGYHIILEGIGDTFRNSIAAKNSNLTSIS